MKTAYLTGDTYMVRDKIQAAGWTWDQYRKAFTRQVEDDATESDIVDSVRRIGGVRNRPKKLVVTFA